MHPGKRHAAQNRQSTLQLAAAAAAAELVTAIIAWHKMEGQKFNKTAVETLFNAFMSRIAR
jgi:hypothetical protein